MESKVCSMCKFEKHINNFYKKKKLRRLRMKLQKNGKTLL